MSSEWWVTANGLGRQMLPEAVGYTHYSLPTTHYPPPHHTIATVGGGNIDVHAAHRRASAGTIDRHSGHSRVFGASISGTGPFSRFTCRMIRKITNATIRKSTIVFRNTP